MLGRRAARLAELLPDLNEWRDSLQSLPGLSTLPYVIEKWQDGDFVPCDTVRERERNLSGRGRNVQADSRWG